MATTGSPITALADFIRTTGQAILSPKDHITNAARRQTHLLKEFMPGLRVDGGSKITDVIYLSQDSSAQHVGINPELDYRIRDVLQDWEIPWRFTVDHHTIPEQAVELNTGGMNAAARFHQFKRYRDGASINMTTSLVQFLDNDLLAQPDFATMEASAGFDPMTLVAYFHENNFTALSTGSAAGYAGTIPAGIDAGGTAWTTVQGLDPATYEGWRSPVVGYGEYGDVALGADLLDAFQMMTDILNFEPIPWRPEHGEKTKLEMGYGIYACSLEGKKNYVNTLTASNDTLASISDPHIMGPNFYGIPLKYIRRMDDAAIYPNTFGAPTAAVAEGDADYAGPRYLALKINDPMYGVSKVCHSNHVFRLKDPFFPSHQPYNLVTVCDTYHNNPCSSRIQGGGVIRPSKDVIQAS